MMVMTIFMTCKDWLEWSKSYVRQRQTFKMNTKGENMAPLAFQSDPDGLYHDLAVQLRNVPIEGLVEDGKGMAIVESASTEESPRRTAPPKTARDEDTPFAAPATPARLEEIKFKRQREIIPLRLRTPLPMRHPLFELRCME